MAPLRRRLSAGYTAIEVLMAMTVFAVGAAGVIAMQRASVQGNVDARRIDSANGIARAWVERLRRDAMMWTQQGNVSQTKFLSQASYYGAWSMPLANCPAATSGTLSNGDGLCPAFDLFGRDLAQDNFAKASFCANIWLQLASGTAAAPDLVRAEVRVYWPRQLTQALNAPYATGAGAGFCDTGALTAPNGPDGATGGSLVYHFVYASTMLRMTPVPQ